MLGYEPSSQLILGRSDGGPRHFLNGHPVHAGSSLELLLDDGTWLPIRYEWTWDPAKEPTAYAALAVPAPAKKIIDPRWCSSRCRRERFCAGPSGHPEPSDPLP